MNKIYRFFVLAATILSPILFFNCSEDQLPANAQISLVRRGLHLTTTSATFGSNSNLTQTIEVKGENTPWTLTGLPSWLKASATSGNGAATITLTAQENTSADEARSAVLTLASTAADYQYSKTITVKQPVAEAYIIPSEKSLSCMPKGETKTVTISSNIEWKATCSEARVTLEKVSDTQLRITVKENLENKTQKHSVHLVHVANGTTLETISITQAEAGVTGRTENISFAVNGEVKTTAINADASWTAKVSDASWLKVSPDQGNAGSATLTITAEASNSASTHNGFVYVYIGSNQKLAIPVSQEGISYKVEPTELTLKSTTETAAVTVTANTTWTVVSKPEWLEVQLPESFTGAQTLTINPQDNPNTTSRSGKIVIGREGFSGNQTINVTQLGKYFDDLEEVMEFSATGGRQEQTISTDGAWEAAVISGDNWIHLIAPTSGQGQGVLKVSVDANPGDDKRDGKITVTVGKKTQTITVVQLGRYIKLSCDDVITKSTPTTVHLSVQSNTEWTASSKVEWLTVTPAQGEDDATLTVFVADNPSTQERTGAISVKSGNITKDFSFTQPGRTLSLSTTALTFAKDGGTSDVIIVTTDGTYEVKSSETWLAINETNNTFTVTASRNVGAARSADITVSLTGLKTGESLEQKIKVTQDAAIADATSKIITANGVSFKMIKVEGGTFQMGSTTGDSDEKPVHQVTLSTYYIGETEVTQELWQAVMGTNPSGFKTSNQLPVEQVSWDDCQTFITKLNELTGQTFRLPTEAEWEFAARGGTMSNGYTYSGSNTVGDVAWNTSNSGSKTHEVATKAPNELGIYDMTGNVYEWCQDWYGSYSSVAQTDPTGPTSGSDLVLRGGGWRDTDSSCRVANRYSRAQSFSINSLGLRLALPSFIPSSQNLCSDSNHPHQIDMGDGIMWSCCNLGANSPTEYGYYYAWGETTPKSSYSWNTYKWCNGTEKSLTKYCANSYYGTVDNKNQLELEDDAARANWGSSWRMPSLDEFSKLFNNCASTWTSLDGVEGMQVKAPNGNTIFFPAAGIASTPGNSNCCYWASTITKTQYSSDADAFSVYLPGSGILGWNYSYYRHFGLTIRPVIGSASNLSISTHELTFPASGGTSEAVTVTTDGTYTITPSDNWLTINKTGNTFTVTASANTGAARSATITVALTGLSKIINVTQAASIDPKISISANGVPLNMIGIEGGTFDMGDNGSEAYGDEKPVHQVTLSSFYIGETEVTQALWETVMWTNPSHFTGVNLPVESVSWEDCQIFISKLNILTGKSFRLPTEAEWEYVACLYYRRNDSWCLYNSGNQTHPVQTKPSSGDIYGMCGNVWEWCQDWYGPYSSSAQTNPTGPYSGDGHVIRGGGWDSDNRTCRKTYRGSQIPSYRSSNLGLRLVLQF